MAGCCDPRGCDGVFGNRFARHVARRYRKRGLGDTEQRMVDFLVDRGIVGSSVLEIGGGVVELHLELLRRGAARATNLELVDAYDAASNELASEAGVSDRIERRVLDIAATPGQVEPADVVLLHRVVCCYMSTSAGGPSSCRPCLLRRARPGHRSASPGGSHAPPGGGCQNGALEVSSWRDARRLRRLRCRMSTATGTPGW